MTTADPKLKRTLDRELYQMRSKPYPRNEVTPDELRPLVQVVNSRGWCGGLFAALVIVAAVALAFGAYAKVSFRNKGFYLTEISDEHTPESLAQRMTGGGYVICEDSRWGKKRTIVVNLADVSCIVLEDKEVTS